MASGGGLDVSDGYGVDAGEVIARGLYQVASKIARNPTNASYRSKIFLQKNQVITVPKSGGIPMALGGGGSRHDQSTKTTRGAQNRYSRGQDKESM